MQWDFERRLHWQIWCCYSLHLCKVFCMQQRQHLWWSSPTTRQILSIHTLFQLCLVSFITWDQISANILLTPIMAFNNPNSKADTKNSIASRISEDCLDPRSWATTGRLWWRIFENLTESPRYWTNNFCLLSSSSVCVWIRNKNYVFV